MIRITIIAATAWLIVLFTCIKSDATILDSLYTSKNYQQIISVYENLKHGYTLEESDLEIIAAAYSARGQDVKAIEILKKVVNDYPLMITYSIPVYYPMHAKLIENGMMDTIKHAIIAKYTREHQEPYLKNGLYILTLAYPDQSVRNKYEYYKTLDSSAERQEMLKKIEAEWKKVDAEDGIAFRKYLDQYGFPDKSNYGMEICNVAWLLITHFDTKYGVKYDEMLRKAACSGDIDCGDYGLYKTRTLYLMNQITGPQMQETINKYSDKNVICK